MQQTVNFQCGHCGNLMAVSVGFLGQQVRCPHCQQVVIAPAAVSTPPPAEPPAPEPLPPFDPIPAPATAPEPPPDRPFANLNASEDIFHQPSETEDALFGPSGGPRLEIPREPVRPLAPEPIPMPLSEPVPVPEPMPLEPAAHLSLPPVDPPSTLTPMPADGVDAHATGWAGTMPTGEATMPWSPAITTPEASGPQPEAVTTGEPSAAVRRAREAAGRMNWFIPLVFIPLVLYAVMATAVAGYLYIKIKSAPKSIFEQMPDVEGDSAGIRYKKSKTLLFDTKEATRELPAHLRVKLGETIRIGDLEVTPTSVERRTVAMFAEGAEEKAEPGPHDALVLNLRLKNVAPDYWFTPLDNYFDRKWESGNAGSAPLTLLQAGRETFFGGPAPWYPRRRDSSKGTRREWLEGRKNFDNEGLGPGEEAKSYVCTNAWSALVSQYLFGVDADGKQVKKPYTGKLLWRVKVRRGLVTWEGERVPAAAVIGVEFTSEAYAGKAGGAG